MNDIKVLGEPEYIYEMGIDGTQRRVAVNLAAKVADSIALIRRGESLALSMDEEGYMVGYSGGKDSECLLALYKLSGVKGRPYMSLTSVDPPEVVKYVRQVHPEVQLIRPKKNIFVAATEKGCVPTMLRRWCCAEYKEAVGAGHVVMVGVRRAESVRRARRKEISVTGHKDEDTTLDQFVARREREHVCIDGKDKIVLSPMLEWTEADVWDFIGKMGLPHCPLYDRGRHRIGCILCPMSSYANKLRDCKEYPYVKTGWLKVLQYIREQREAKGKKNMLSSAEEDFAWWISGMCCEDFIARRDEGGGLPL